MRSSKFPVTVSSSDNEAEVHRPRRPPSTSDRIASLEQKVDKLLALFATLGSTTVSEDDRLLSADYDRVLRGPLKRRTSSASNTSTSSLHELQEHTKEISDLLNSQPLSSAYRPPERLSQRRAKPVSGDESSGLENCHNPDSDVSGIIDLQDSADEKTLSCSENQSSDDSSASGTTSLISDLEELLTQNAHNPKTLQHLALLIRSLTHLDAMGISAVLACAYALASDRIIRLEEEQESEVAAENEASQTERLETSVITQTSTEDATIETSDSVVSDGEEKQDEDEVDRSIALIKRRVLHIVNYVQTILTKVLGETENNAFFTEDLLTFIGDSIDSALQAHQQSISNLPNMPNEAKELVQLENAQISQIVASLLAAIVGYPLTTESLHIVVDQLRATLFRELIKLHVTCPFSRSASEASNSESEQSEKEFDDSCSETSEISSSLAQGLAKAEEKLAELEKQRTMLEEQLALLTSLVDMNPSESQESQSSEAEQTDDDVSDIQSNIIIDTERILHEKTADHQCEQPGCTHGAHEHWWQTMGKEGDIEDASEGDICTPPRVTSPVVENSEDFVELTDTVRRVVDPEKKVVDVNVELITLDDFEANQQPSDSDMDLTDVEKSENTVEQNFSQEFEEEQRREAEELLRKFELGSSSETPNESDLENSELSGSALQIILEKLAQCPKNVQEKLVSALNKHIDLCSSNERN
ncbi:hypothetical protein RCL1_002940 [Eukaryota sp. TZLM3-RCL]